jgi:hypothetical protein
MEDAVPAVVVQAAAGREAGLLQAAEDLAARVVREDSAVAEAGVAARPLRPAVIA